MLTKSKSVGVEGSLWLSSIAMTCFMILMSVESSVDLVVEAGAMVGACGHRSHSAVKHKVHGLMDLF